MGPLVGDPFAGRDVAWRRLTFLFPFVMRREALWGFPVRGALLAVVETLELGLVAQLVRARA